MADVLEMSSNSIQDGMKKAGVVEAKQSNTPAPLGSRASQKQSVSSEEDDDYDEEVDSEEDIEELESLGLLAGQGGDDDDALAEEAEDETISLEASDPVARLLRLSRASLRFLEKDRKALRSTQSTTSFSPPSASSEMNTASTSSTSRQKEGKVKSSASATAISGSKVERQTVASTPVEAPAPKPSRHHSHRKLRDKDKKRTRSDLKLNINVVAPIVNDTLSPRSKQKAKEKAKLRSKGKGKDKEKKKKRREKKHSTKHSTIKEEKGQNDSKLEKKTEEAKTEEKEKKAEKEEKVEETEKPVEENEAKTESVEANAVKTEDKPVEVEKEQQVEETKQDDNKDATAEENKAMTAVENIEKEQLEQKTEVKEPEEVESTTKQEEISAEKPKEIVEQQKAPEEKIADEATEATTSPGVIVEERVEEKIEEPSTSESNEQIELPREAVKEDKVETKEDEQKIVSTSEKSEEKQEEKVDQPADTTEPQKEESQVSSNNSHDVAPLDEDDRGKAEDRILRDSIIKDSPLTQEVTNESTEEDEPAEHDIKDSTKPATVVEKQEKEPEKIESYEVVQSSSSKMTNNICVRDEYGFAIKKEEFDAWQAEKDNAAKKSLREKRQAFWSKFTAKKFKITFALKETIRGGIPSQYRSLIWQHCTGSIHLMKRNPGVYESLLTKTADQTSSATIQINLDLRRTFPENDVYMTDEGIERLRKVLVAYSWYNPEVGYCQSMNFVCGMLLLFMSEEEAFWMMVVIVEKYLNGYYTNTMESSHVDQRVLRQLVARKLPSLSDYLQKCGVELSWVTRQWFLCIFIDVLPVETTLRVWDAFFMEGSKVLFRMALALLKLKQQKILATPDDGISILKEIKEAGLSLHDADSLLKIGFHRIGGLSRASIAKLRTAHRVHVIKARERAESFR